MSAGGGADGYAGIRIAAAESGFDGVSLARRAAALVGLFRFVDVEKSESRAVGSMAAAAASSLPMLGPEIRVNGQIRVLNV